MLALAMLAGAVALFAVTGPVAVADPPFLAAAAEPDTSMKKLALALALVIATIGGTATVFTLVSTHAAYADPTGNGGGY